MLNETIDIILIKLIRRVNFMIYKNPQRYKNGDLCSY